MVAPYDPDFEQISPKDIPYLILGGSRDSDVDTDPLHYYDRATLTPERYLEWVYGANHRFWNTRATLFPAAFAEFSDVTGSGLPGLMPTLTASREVVSLKLVVVSWR